MEFCRNTVRQRDDEAWGKMDPLRMAEEEGGTHKTQGVKRRGTAMERVLVTVTPWERTEPRLQ